MAVYLNYVNSVVLLHCTWYTTPLTVPSRTEGLPQTPPRVSSKRKKNRLEPKQTETKICFGCVSVCFVKPKTKIFGLLELLRIKPKQTKTTLNFLKNTIIFRLVFCLFRFNQHIKTCCFSIEFETTDTNRNKTKQTETNRRRQNI